jgi:hypothetical protein
VTIFVTGKEFQKKAANRLGNPLSIFALHYEGALLDAFCRHFVAEFGRALDQRIRAMTGTNDPITESMTGITSHLPLLRQTEVIFWKKHNHERIA